MPDDPPYFLRKNFKKESIQANCLASPLMTEKGVVLLNDLIPKCDLNNYWIPAVWPEGKEQRDYCCGLYALDIGLKHGFGRSGIDTPVARKDGDNNIVSLREYAKKQSLTAFGEIYSVNTFKKLTNAFHFPHCDILKPNQKDETLFTKMICDKLRSDHVIITSLDMKGSFPAASKGQGTHWALLFGYLYHEGKCYFLATQWGLYFLFPAEKVFLSNKQLPKDNPKIFPHYIYYKKDGTSFYRQKQKDDDLSELNIKHPIGETLDEFRFSLFSIPVIDAPACIDLKKVTMKVR